VIGLILLAAGFVVNRLLESYKTTESRHSTEIEKKIEFIDRQLSDFYWPVSFRLDKDNAVWVRLNEPQTPLTSKIEAGVILPNHKEIQSIIDSKSALIFNPWEPLQPVLLDAIKRYERHVAVYFALRENADSRYPADLKEPWPEDFYPLIQKRIEELHDQRNRLSSR